MARALFVCTWIAWAALSACDRSKPTPPTPTSAPVVEASATKAPSRVVAIGDLHGDLAATRKVLRIAGAIDASDKWIGGTLVVVQTGDQIDRGDDDRAILNLFERLAADAKQAGGEVISLVGNHELMNAVFDFRYVTPGAFVSFADVRGPAMVGLDGLEPSQRGRAAAFAPAGPYARMLAKRPVVARVGDSVFVHGGVLPKHVRYGIDRINTETRAWLEGSQTDAPRIVMAEDGPVWTRMYSAAPGPEECTMLGETLALLNAKRMIMGHTPQKPGIQPACDRRAWRIDVGLAKFYEGPSQALELVGDNAKVIGEGAP